MKKFTVFATLFLFFLLFSNVMVRAQDQATSSPAPPAATPSDMAGMESTTPPTEAFVLEQQATAESVTPVAVLEAVPDPSGANTGGAGDVAAATAGKPTVDEVAAVAGHSKVAINMVWTLIAGVLVMFMQCGFAMVETGMTRAKNVAHTMAMNFMVYALSLIHI